MKRMESFLLAVVLTGWGGAVNGAVIYVDADATGSNTGTSWCNAYIDLSFAIFIANHQGGPDEIRVAQQTYKPTTTTIRTVSFALHNNLEIYGGYAGCGETNPDDRNVATYVTIMSGDIGTQGFGRGSGDTHFISGVRDGSWGGGGWHAHARVGMVRHLAEHPIPSRGIHPARTSARTEVRGSQQMPPRVAERSAHRRGLSPVN